MDKQRSLSRLRQVNARIRATDPELARPTVDFMAGVQMEGAAFQDIDRAIAEESIVMRRLRPVLAIKDDKPELVFKDKEEGVLWEERLRRAKPVLDAAIRAVGRIDLTGSVFEWVGTGWLVAENLILTNRHVANAFAERSGEGFEFKMGSAGRIGAALDFVQEIESDKQLVFKVVRPLHIEPSSGPDISLFEIEMISGDAKLAQPIRLAKKAAQTNSVAVIGYPAYDSRIPDPDLMESIYGRTYNKKRLAPGAVTRVEPMRLEHDCTTLGGNSGSVVLNLDSGEAYGLHFSGTFMTANYAVPCDVVAKVVDDVREGRARREMPRAVTPARAPAPSPTRQMSRAVSLTVPLTITVTIGDAQDSGRTPSAEFGLPEPQEQDEPEATEAPVAEYRDRRGYQHSFLGAKDTVDLPTVKRDAHDVLPLDDGSGTELKYEHFSVIMSKSRRMCFFSAVNIDGGQSRKSARAAWKLDPRIPRVQQIMGECYGNPPKFSRGHMTRREDPGWGDAATAKRGNEDSMHVTNVTPQIQAFNAPIWLALEDYALLHAREDEMKISVLTGPYFRVTDPTMYGVHIPLAFWKIIAFIHDRTGKLCATGYEMTQKQSLPEEEFVYGRFRSPQLNVATQVPIGSIEAKSGLFFGNLASFDPLHNGQEAFMDDRLRPPLEVLEQIRFL